MIWMMDKFAFGQWWAVYNRWSHAKQKFKPHWRVRAGIR